ncbi:UPF0280 family protein [Desulforhopalus sp. IMCC35007]|uniref:UPF0280 family protein n=1 Tax=Desulforhopalus sp. IMCC35007 TaxID=2569543 RepID=UPI0010AE6F63|nr:UPF0280 family protein [Desulforhopalus sp. IMCC35007]TKB09265.1 UPF0280 family protein [Desulforhopalus sp. IMCC35007]
MRHFRTFSWKDTHLKVYGRAYEQITQAVVRERRVLEAYIRRHPQFQTALTPIKLLEDAPEVAVKMANAATLTGLGPMASVAGTLAQLGVEAAKAAGCEEAIVENGGDMFIMSPTPVTIGIFAGHNSIGAQLAFHLLPEDLPLSICSSSSKMGHSMSFGDCELATVVAKEAALADSAATLVCNRISAETDVEQVLDEVGRLGGIRGILVVNNNRVGLWGKLPQLVRNQDSQTLQKITRAPNSSFK